MTDKFFVGALLTGALFGLLMLVAIAKAQQLERPRDPHVTRQWHVAMLPEEGVYAPGRVDVIDTAGVCLYVVRAWGTGAGTAIAAVSKAQLPAGTGCQ
jgi:hypothetical protein